MLKLDKWLLERVFEPAAREVETWIGVVPTRLARFCVLVQVVADATKALQERTPMAYTILGLGLLSAGCLVAMTFLAEHLAKRKGTANSFKHEQFYSYVRIIEFFLAASSVVMGLLVMSLTLSTISFVGMATAWYFLSCDRLPPKERRVFQPVAAVRQGS